ncbi:four helix bundle protein [Aequorivita sp. F47161]|uniref:Four helix bundle protein n=1 Tax=Aequorivita vitellina TaxID=2874475 RepID=A0A9X1QVX0_9FLAO|nr:four helix bundle protein [Aequorivita vitellina]
MSNLKYQFFIKSELYNLMSQFKRASVSIALNTVEGQGDTNAHFNRLLQVVLDWVKECVVYATIAKRLYFRRTRF